MKHSKTNIIISVLFISIFFIVGCSSNTDEVVSSSYKRAIVTHNDFDFSEGKEEASPQLWYGSINKWQPRNGEHSTYINTFGGAIPELIMVLMPQSI